MERKTRLRLLKIELDELKGNAKKIDALLKKMTEEERKEIILKTLNEINRGIDKVIDNPKLVNRFGKELQNMMPWIMGCVMYSFKPEFSDVYKQIILKLLALTVVVKK